METLSSILRTKLSQAIAHAFPHAAMLFPADITPSTQEEFGHYQSNSALKLSKIFAQPPNLIAQKILEHFDSSICTKIEVAGKGFINFTLSSEFLSKQLQNQLFDPLLGATPPQHKQRIIIDFSSPNVAKELHVGHIRSTIIGDCLARLFEFLQQDVVRLNHIGDWGTQFGMLITYMKEHAPNVLQGKQKADLNDLMRWYRASKQCFDKDPAFKKMAQEEVVNLQSNEPKSYHAWQIICDISRIGFQEIYDLLDIRIIARGESFYNPFLKEVVEEFEKKGVAVQSEGAKCVYLEGFKNRDGDPFPLIIQKSDGGYNYDTTDLAAIRHRIFVEKADRIIYVTDIGQSLHFQMIFAAAEKIGWLDPKKVLVDHVGFGLVLGPDGKKFKTRSGETEKLIDLLTKAVEHARALVQERIPNADPQEVDHLAYVLGIGAVKYADLASCRTKDYTFNYDRMLRFEGNTAVFLLYSYVRINGIKKKTCADIATVLKEHSIAIHHISEIALGVHLLRFAEILEFMVRDLLPHRLADYLYELAEKFNAFFRDCHVEGTPEEGSRLALCELTARVLRQGLAILGIQTIDRM